MGRVLQIRVMAYTYDDSEVARAWPGLHRLAFPEPSPPSDLTHKKGVLELVESLADQLRFDMLESSLQKVLKQRIEQAKTLKTQLEKALADWNPPKANTLSNELEDLLDALEQDAPVP